ncbi:hypothetical protein GQR58_020175 [Nymphon striatum]|nr:hypothetical protein GQR58_020175 [Nymphon striatum]
MTFLSSGSFKKTQKKFSSIPVDQAHEQSSIVKGSGGAVDLTENPVTFSRWMVGGPEMARLLKEFQIETITEIGNPYRDDFKELVALDTYNCADASVITTVNTIEERMPPSYYVAKIFDGTVIVLALPLSTVTTFSKYADKVFLPFLTTQLQTAIRIDVVWDTYHSESLKEATREKRGKGPRKRVSDKTKLPKNWNKFLLDAVNK